MAASRHARAITVTRAMDHLDFVAPVHVGDLPDFEGQCEPGVQDFEEVGVQGDGGGRAGAAVEACFFAYLTYVAVDQTGKGLLVPQLIMETEHQKRRFEGCGAEAGDEEWRDGSPQGDASYVGGGLVCVKAVVSW